MARTDDYEVVARYLIKERGWHHECTSLISHTYEEAGRVVQDKAKQLDARHGDSHFWTVDLYLVKDGERVGSMFQLFHGRTS